MERRALNEVQSFYVSKLVMTLYLFLFSIELQAQQWNLDPGVEGYLAREVQDVHVDFLPEQLRLQIVWRHQQTMMLWQPRGAVSWGKPYGIALGRELSLEVQRRGRVFFVRFITPLYVLLKLPFLSDLSDVRYLELDLGQPCINVGLRAGGRVGLRVAIDPQGSRLRGWTLDAADGGAIVGPLLDFLEMSLRDITL